LMLELNKLRLTELQVNLPKRTQTLITGHSCKAANYCMTTCPSSSYRTTFTPYIFRVLLKYHLGIPILAYPQPCLARSEFFEFLKARWTLQSTSSAKVS
jgi:hypothetical protein